MGLANKSTKLLWTMIESSLLSFMIISITTRRSIVWFFFLDDGVTGDIPQLFEQEKGSFKYPYSEKKVKEVICKWSIIRPLDLA
jgi:hypothetical protein